MGTQCSPFGAPTGQAPMQEFSGPEPKRSHFGEPFCLETICSVFGALLRGPGPDDICRAPGPMQGYYSG